MTPIPKTSRRETTAVQRAQIWDRYEQGHRISEIVNHFDLPRSTVQGIINRRLKNGDDTFQNKPGRGRNKKTDERSDRRLLRHATTYPKDTLFALTSPSKSGQQLGRCTVRKILKTGGKAKRKPRRKLYIKPAHKLRRKIWCKQRKIEKRKWNRVCWSDEVSFEIGHDGTVIYVTRGPGEEYLDKNLRPSFKSGRTTVGVWSYFCGDEMGPLVILEKGERMTGKRYIEILENYFIPFYYRMREKYGSDVVMQEDNAPWHTAKVVQKYLEQQKIERLDWPA